MSDVEDRLWWYRSLHGLVFKAIERNVGGNKNIVVIDAGCGTGGLMQALKTNGIRNVTGFDLSKDAVEISEAKQLSVRIGDLRNIGDYYAPQSADVIVSNDTFCFLDSRERLETTERFHQVLKPEGIVIMNLPALKAFEGIHDISVGIKYRFSKRDIAGMFNLSRFKVICAEFWPFSLSPVIFLTRIVQRLKLRVDKNTPIISDIDLPALWLNKLLLEICGFENRCIRGKPWGSSLLLVVKKR